MRLEDDRQRTLPAVANSADSWREFPWGDAHKSSITMIPRGSPLTSKRR
jgi:hypothetical protein